MRGQFQGQQQQELNRLQRRRERLEWAVDVWQRMMGYAAVLLLMTAILLALVMLSVPLIAMVAAAFVYVAASFFILESYKRDIRTTGQLAVLYAPLLAGLLIPVVLGAVSALPVILLTVGIVLGLSRFLSGPWQNWTPFSGLLRRTVSAVNAVSAKLNTERNTVPQQQSLLGAQVPTIPKPSAPPLKTLVESAAELQIIKPRVQIPAPSAPPSPALRSYSNAGTGVSAMGGPGFFANNGGKTEYTQLVEGDRDDHPKSHCCPITQEVMKEPVMAADGHSYEKAAITKWLSEHNTSPLTNEVLPHKGLTPNHALRSAIEEYRNGANQQPKEFVI